MVKRNIIVLAMLCCLAGCGSQNDQIGDKNEWDSDGGNLFESSFESDTDILEGMQTEETQTEGAEDLTGSFQIEKEESTKGRVPETSETKQMTETVDQLEDNQEQEVQDGQDASFLPEMMLDCPAGTVLSKEQLLEDRSTYFQMYEISDDLYDRIRGKSFPEGDLMEREQLRYLKVIHYNYEHEEQIGELIVAQKLAEEFLEIFMELYDAGYEINSMYLVDDFWTGDGDTTDTASMAANNPSCFNYRPVSGSQSLSKHALGRAIDINPLENPYVTFPNGTQRVSPPGGEAYVDREQDNAHIIREGDVCVSIFKAHGFTWGGNWKTMKDYQHFQKTE